MLPNDPVLGEPPPDIFLIISRTIGIPTLAKRSPKNLPNCVLHGFIPKKPSPSEDFSICLASVYLSIIACVPSTDQFYFDGW